MPLLLTEADVQAILTMPLALELVEQSFLRLADGTAVCHPRQRLRLAGKGFMHYMAASDSAGGYVGLKIYTVSPSGVRFLVPLFSGQSGELLALIEANHLGQTRTGAASGAATPVMPMASAEEAVRGADILITSTNATHPVVEGRWLERGVHINAIGINFADRREIDSETVNRADVIAADSVEQSKIEAGDLILAFGADAQRWKSVLELSDIVSGKIAGRTNAEQITLFKSNGIA